ncbi:hypothetical protein ACFTSF_40860 [Kribbella sp. NPDC056951]|uniref:hypothetical protein n=1 Tax=Kribbella sp. NPDC056951 TaxID=3345978 RepID=UPI003644B420
MGLLCALAAAVAYGLASVLQAAAARSTPDESARGVLRVVGQWRFLAGIALDVLGFGLQMVALQSLPLFLVQAALAASLAVTAVAARVLGVRLGTKEWSAVAAVCTGLALLGMSAGKEGSTPVGHGFRLSLVGATIVLGLAGLATQRASQRLRAPLLGLVAGLAFGVVAISGRIITDFHPLKLLAEPALYTAVVSGALAMFCYASALQRGGVTMATAMLVVGETVFPALVGLIALGDHSRPGFGAVAVGGFLLAVAAAVVLARFGEVTTPAGSPPSHESSV